MSLRFVLAFLGLLCGLPGAAWASSPMPRSLTQPEILEVTGILQGMKRDPRGPYLRIRWFCQDGTVQPPAGTPCQERGGGVQHAERNAAALRLAELGFHVGILFQPLTFDAFFDQANDHQLLKQLVLQQYLQEVDDGWILRRARFYRGARQIEDEERQGESFLRTILEMPDWTDRNFLLVLRLASVVPHPDLAHTNTDKVRNLATAIANLDVDFQNLRSKIHSFPEAEDAQRVRAFLASKKHPNEIKGKLQELLDTMESGRSPDQIRQLIQRFQKRLPELKERLTEIGQTLEKNQTEKALAQSAALAADLRRTITSESAVQHNLYRLDLLRALLERCFILAGEDSKVGISRARLERIRNLAHYYRLAFASGLLTERELAALLEEIRILELQAPAVPALQLKQHLSYLSRSLDWAQASIRQTFGTEFSRSLAVEPKTSGFLDAAARASILLPLSTELDNLARDADDQLEQSHIVGDTPINQGLRGLNPGVARGILDFAPEIEEGWQPDAGRIYVIPDTVADLKPMAGILTLDAGNLLSHAQLLARNLGIPNASLSSSLIPEIRRLAGREIFYAVTPLGRVLIRDLARLSPSERSLLAQEEGGAGSRVDLDVSRVRLQRAAPISLRDLRSSDSGVVVGPKAANLGQLKSIFPDHVAEGVALPFGMFYQHINRPFATKKTLAEEIQEAHQTARDMEAADRSQDEIDGYMFQRLSYFRTAILELPWTPQTLSLVEEAIRKLPRLEDGIFIRSDTNAEDLPQFSGAGLNLTVPHRKRVETILAAIRAVWASPFSERAYLWRRRVLNSQENVYCSVLLLQSVPSDESGVLITTGLEMGEPEDLTVVTAEGVGGAVDGQIAETLLVRPSGEWKLLSQARAPFRRVLSQDGEGVELLPSRRDSHLLTQEKVRQLQAAVQRWKSTLSPDLQSEVWDIEFGFVRGKLWLFQIRPFVEHRNARIMESLRRFDEALARVGQKRISLEEPIS